MILLRLLVANSKIMENEEYVHNIERKSCFKTSTWWPKTRWKFLVFARYLTEFVQVPHGICPVPHGNELWRRELGGNSLAFVRYLTEICTGTSRNLYRYLTEFVRYLTEMSCEDGS